jgi:hypothetical protein
MSKKIKYTQEELKFIEMCFVETLFHFIQNPLNRDNPDDIREAINYRNYNIGSIGPYNHDLMHSIFDKMGYCNDGKTTKTEKYQRELQFEKEKAEAWGIKRSELIEKIDAQIAELKQMKKDYLDFETDYQKMIKEEAAKVKAQFQEDMKKEKVVMQKNLEQNITERKDISDMTVRELKAFAKEKGIKGATHQPNKAALKALVEANL